MTVAPRIPTESSTLGAGELRSEESGKDAVGLRLRVEDLKNKSYEYHTNHRRDDRFYGSKAMACRARCQNTYPGENAR
jgi:hypothetical protein